MNPYIENRELYWNQLPKDNTIKLYETEDVLLEAYKYSPARILFGDHNIWIQDMVSKGFTMETIWSVILPKWLNMNFYNESISGISAFCGDIYMGGNLYHFIFDNLARAWWLNTQIPNIDNYIFYAHVEPWSRYIISRMFKNVLYLPNHHIYHCDSLYFFSNINKYRNDIKDDDPFPKDNLKKRRVNGPALKCKTGFLPELRKLLLQEIQNYKSINRIQPIKKLYVSRKKSDRRGIVNEEHIENILISKGFGVVYFEELSPIVQLTLWNSAEIIITPHGAGQSNMIVQDKDTLVYELDTKNSEVYHTLAYLLDIHLKSIDCLEKKGDDNFVCNISKFNSFIDTSKNYREKVKRIIENREPFDISNITKTLNSYD